MAQSPRSGRAVAFFDGQNLFYAAKEAFGHDYPKYDPFALASTVCAAKGWTLVETRFYTGVPPKQDNPFWHGFWERKLGAMGKRPGVKVVSRPLKYRSKAFIDSATGRKCLSVPVGHEKGIDVRIALDIVAQVLVGTMEVALIFSQDQDLAEAVEDAKDVALHTTGRKLWLASAYPKSDKSSNPWGIRGTESLPIDEATYNLCCDAANYSVPPPVPPPAIST